MKISEIVIVFLLISGAPVCAVPVTFISPGQITSAPFSITAPGRYVLADDVSYATAGGTAITINASDVTLDLNGKAIINSALGVENGIALAATFTNITIQNGAIRVFDGIGISVPAGCSDLFFDDITIIGASTTTGTAFNYVGTVGAVTRTVNVSMKNCRASNCFCGLLAIATDAVKIRTSTFNKNGSRSINATNCDRWDLDSCQASYNSSAAEGIGVSAISCGEWLLKNSDFSGNAGGTSIGRGILFQVGANGSGGHAIKCCTFNNNNSTSSTGIGLELQSTNSCIIFDCQASDNFSAAGAAGGVNVSGTAIIFERCVMSGNVALSGANSASGLEIEATSTGIVVRDCIASSNTALGTGDGDGILVNGGFSHMFEQCTLNGNASFGGGLGRGLLLLSTAERCLIKNCTATGNTHRGLQHDATLGANLFIGNTAFGHGTSGVNNFVGNIPFLSVAATGPYPLAGSFDNRELANLSFT